MSGDAFGIGDRSDIRALLGAHGDLLLFLTEKDCDPERGVWRAQLQRLAERYVRTVAEVRDAGLLVELAGGDTSRDGLRLFISGAAGQRHRAPPDGYPRHGRPLRFPQKSREGSTLLQSTACSAGTHRS